MKTSPMALPSSGKMQRNALSRQILHFMSVGRGFWQRIPVILPRRSRGLPSPRPFTPRTVMHAMPDASSIEVAQTASDLIIRASEGALPVQAHNVTQFLHAMHSAMDVGGMYNSAHLPAVDVGHIAHQVTTTVAPFTATLPGDALSLDPELVSAAQQDLASTAVAWSDAAMTLAGPQAANLQALASLAADRLSSVEAIDAASFLSLQSSMESLLAGLKDMLDLEAGQQAGQLTNALVLGVQQLVAMSRLEETGGAYSINAMAEAQAAFEQAAKSNPVNLDGFTTLTMGIIVVILACLPRGSDAKKGGSGTASATDGPPARYDPEALSAYFAKRPLTVIQRAAEVISKLVGFLLSIMMDAQTGQWEAKMPSRAKQLRKIIESMGATSIKIAQAFSTRVDMLPQAYLDEFVRLQDNVPTFSTMEARVVLEEGLGGRPVDAIFEWLSEEPIAAASLGQVYRGKLRSEYGAGEVAVKVQRPGVLEAAALDIFLLRRAAGFLAMIPGMSAQWQNTLDDWALRFFQEMDYQLEAYNTMTFQQQMSSLQGIVVATVYPELTSNKVIVSEWIVAERLSDCKPAELKAMCSTFLNCYLIQLMETGLLHADPHPGNLMRTADGKLVILDFGLMTEVNENQRIGLVEFIAHLTIEDWDSLFQDLVTLGFMPEDMDPEAAKHITPVLKQVMSKILHGGGLGKAGLNFTTLFLQLQGVAMSYQLCIPPYFTNVLRAFGTIEGIALKVDPDYGIVQECMPYLSRRLLTDNNPRMRAALRQLLYGDGQRLDVNRLQSLISSFGSFSTSQARSVASGPTFSSAYEERIKGTALTRSNGFGAEEPVLNETMKEALKVVFAKDGSYAQELIVEELVAVIDAMSREALSEALRLVMGSATAVTALRSVEALGPLRAMLMPLPLPLEMLHSMEPAVALTKEDRQALNTLRAILDLMQPSLFASMGGGGGGVGGLPGSVAMAGRNTLRAAGEVMPMLPDLLPGVQVTVELFFRQLIRRMAIRLAEDLEPGKFGVPQSPYAPPQATGYNPRGSAAPPTSATQFRPAGAPPSGRVGTPMASPSQWTKTRPV